MRTAIMLLLFSPLLPAQETRSGALDNGLKVIVQEDHGIPNVAMYLRVIAQALSIALSIRELIRQGYLFGAHVLLRALVERAVILLYLHLYSLLATCPRSRNAFGFSGFLLV